VNSTQQDDDDYRRSDPQTSVFHRLLVADAGGFGSACLPPTAPLPILLGSLTDNRALANLQKRLFGPLDNEAVFLHFFDLAYDSAVCQDLIVTLKLRDQVLKLLLLSLLRKDNEEIEDAVHDQQRQEDANRAEYSSAASGVLKKQ